VNRILALDTTSEFGSLALLADGALVASESLHSPDGFGHILFGRLAEFLGRNAWKIEEIDCFAAAAGPGSFTGVRVGLAAAKGLAAALGKLVVPVSNLEAVAWFGQAPLRAAILDARRGQIYAGLYDAALQPVLPEAVAPLAHWLDALPESGLEFLSPDCPHLAQALAATRFAAAPVHQTPRSLAPAIAAIAHQRFSAGQALDPAQVDANYVRRSDAELFWKDPA